MITVVLRRYPEADRQRSLVEDSGLAGKDLGRRVVTPNAGLAGFQL
jgi:hypothetical protein